MAVVDASVVVELVAPDAPDDDACRALLEQWAEADEILHAPGLLGLEVLNALLTGLRRRRWDGQAADAAASFAAALPIVIHDVDADRNRAWELARRYDNYPVYDMAYVALAERLDQPLITLDQRLHARLSHLGWILRPEEALVVTPPIPDPAPE